MPNEPENSSSSSSSSTEPEKKPRKPRGPLNQAHIDEVADTRDIITAFHKPEHKQALIDRDVTEADVTALAGLCDRAEDAITGGHAATVAKEQLTAEEAIAKAALTAGIATTQRGALRTFRSDQRARLEDYFIGEDLDTNLARLKTIAIAILAKLQPGPNNTPPPDVRRGVKAPDIQALADALAVLTAKDNAQGAAQVVASGERRTADELIADIIAARLDIQLAADQEWPWTTREHDLIRAQFKLERRGDERLVMNLRELQRGERARDVEGGLAQIAPARRRTVHVAHAREDMCAKFGWLGRVTAKKFVKFTPPLASWSM